MPVSFMWSVECRSLPRPDFEVKMVPYGLASKDWATGGRVVAMNGDTKGEDGKDPNQWAVAVDMMGEYLPVAEPGDLYAASATENITRFIVGMRPQASAGKGKSKGQLAKAQAFLQPMVKATPEGVASPTVGGNGRKGGSVRPAAGKFMGVSMPPTFAYKTLDIEYRCFAPGTVTITVEIPFPDNNFAPVIFTWKKTCGGTPPRDLNIITSFDESVVVKGIVQPEWTPISGDHNVFASDPETIFRLSKSRGTRQTTRFDTPSINAVSTSDPDTICNPTLDGNGRKGGTIRAVDKGAAIELKVLYNCIKAGTAIITMEIPLAMSVEPLTVSWTKTCGGIPRQFFSVTTWEKAVVKDGITYDDWAPEYVGESFAAIVDSSEDDTAFYISLEAVDESNVAFYEPDWADWMDDVEEPEVPPNMMAQTYQRPRIETSNPATCNPSLSGTASKGGTIASYSQSDAQLDVHYHCLRQGEATVTVTIPVGVYADVVFSWRKVCKKEFVTGLMVGTSPTADDVVSDGHAQVLFDTSPSAEGRRMVVDKDTKESTFFVATTNGKRVVDYKEPHVSADPPICSPRVSGVMRKGGELSAEDPQTISVRYNCAVGGSTVITMRIPLEDDSKEAITWAWRKNNGPSPLISDAMNGEEHWENHEVGSLLMVRHQSHAFDDPGSTLCRR